MAVVVQCFNCSAVIELDEGFRGGVCRCSGCGTLLQVPRGEVDQARRKSRPATPMVKRSTGSSVAAPGEPGPLRSASQKENRAEPNSSTATDAGGSSSALRQVHPTRPITHAMEASDLGKPGPELNAEAAASPSGTHAPLSRQRSGIGKPDKNDRLLWTALGFLALLAIGVMISLVIYWPRGEEGTPAGGTRPSPATTRSIDR